MKQSANEKNKLRLQVFLSHHGVCSRRKAMDLIKDGKVSLNGEIILEPSTPVDPQRDEVCFEGRRVCAEKYEYVLLYKPLGYTTTLEDPFAEKIVSDLLPENLKNVKPVGRLDKNTEGLLLLTNDGQIAYKMTHPSFHVDKIYFARIKGVLKEQDKGQLEKGVVFDGQKTAPCKIFDVRREKEETTLRIVLREGRKRQVRRMFDVLGYEVIFLKREQQGPLKLGELKPGEIRRLTEQEIQILQKL
ncbi:MAG: pseudouridine synthase [Candidatus Omnitrophica bacterium]|nr:pseudouridine synthase [Candidatus Omnitrophota bacterium]